MKKATAVINKILNLANFELRRRGKTVQSLRSYPRLGSAGKIVEIIGTQGIGKTTLNNDLHKSLRNNWFFRSDLGQIGPSEVASLDIEGLHRDIYLHRIRHLQEKQVDPWKIITNSRAMGVVVSESLTIQTNEFPRGFILDEGLFKNLSREVLALASEHPEPLWVNRAFVYLRARDPEFLVSRHQGRVAARRERGLPLRPPSDAEVRSRITHDNDLFDQIVEKAEAFDCPVVVINPDGNYHEIINKVLQFERQLRTEAWHGSVWDSSQT